MAENVTVAEHEIIKTIFNQYSGEYSSVGEIIQKLSKRTRDMVEAASALFIFVYYWRNHKYDFLENIGSFEDILDFIKEDIHDLEKHIEEIQDLDEDEKQKSISVHSRLIPVYQKRFDDLSEIIELRDSFLSDYDWLLNDDQESLSYLFIVASLAVCRLWKKDYPDYEVFSHLSRIFMKIRNKEINEPVNYEKKRQSINIDDNKDVIGITSCLACAVICNSFANILIKREDPNYVDCFVAFVEGTNYIERTDIASDFLPLPFTDSVGSDYEVGKVLDAWESVKTNSITVKNWTEIKNRMNDFERHADKIFYDPSAVFGDRYGYEHYTFFPAESEYILGNMNANELRSVLNDERRLRDVKRMRYDYFAGLWDEFLGEDTKQKILEAEFKWYEGSERLFDVVSSIEQYSYALETELHEIIFKFPPIKEMINNIVKKKLNIVMNLNVSWKNVKISAKDKCKILENISKIGTSDAYNVIIPVKVYIDNLPTDARFKEMLYCNDFTTELRKIIEYRNIEAHPKNEKEIMQDVRTLRKKILGIDQMGYLPMIARIKRDMIGAGQYY